MMFEKKRKTNRQKLSQKLSEPEKAIEFFEKIITTWNGLYIITAWSIKFYSIFKKLSMSEDEWVLWTKLFKGENCLVPDCNSLAYRVYFSVVVFSKSGPKHK